MTGVRLYYNKIIILSMPGVRAAFVLLIRESFSPCQVYGRPFVLLIRESFSPCQVYKTVVEAAGSMVRTEGVRSLYKGLVPTLMQIAPQTGFQFGFYSLLNSAWRSTFGEDGTSVFGEKRF